MNQTSRTLSAPTLALALRGRHLRGATLGEELADEPTLVAFLRHLG